MTGSKNKQAPQYCHHKPTNQGYVRINGRMIYLGKYGTPEGRRTYDRIISEWLVNGRQLPAGGHTDLTLDELAARYWQHVEVYYVKDGAPTNEQQNIRRALRPVCDLYGDVAAAKFSPTALIAVRQTMIDAGLVRKQVNKQVDRIRRMFRWGVEQELVSSAVLEALRAVRGLRAGRSEARESVPIKPVPDEYVAAIKPFVSRQVAAIIDLQRLTGMRSGEVTIMRGCDVDMAGEIWQYRPSTHKTVHHGHERVIELGPQAQVIVKQFLKPDVEAYLFSPADAMSERRAKAHQARSTPLSCGNRPGTNRRRRPTKLPGERYTTSSYGQAIAKACNKAGVPHWHPHQLRHAKATEVRRKYGLEAARAVLGQKSVPVTELYAEIDLDKARQIAAETG